MELDEMHSLLQSSVSESRYRHTMGVIETSARLSAIHNADESKAYLSALLHDCAKRMSIPDMISISREEGYEPDEQELSSEAVLHAPAGAALAKRLYGVTDEAVLNAIRSHTIGCLRPTKLDAVLFVSDFIEPFRKPFSGLNDVRKLAQTDLLGAMKLSARLSGEYVEKCGGRIHPITIKMINDTEDLI